MTLAILANDQEGNWSRIDKNDVVSSFYDDSLKVLSTDIIDKYNIKDGDKKDTFLSDEEFEEAIADCDYAPTYMESYIDCSEIDESKIYFDAYTDTFFTGEDILSRETDDFYYYYDGSNWQMKEISQIKEVEAELIDNEAYDTGSIETWKLPNGDIFKIDSSRYQGSIDTVDDCYFGIIDQYEDDELNEE